MRAAPLRNLATKLLLWLLLVTCRGASVFVGTNTHVGHQACRVLMFLLEFIGMTCLRHGFTFPCLWQLCKFSSVLRDLTCGWGAYSVLIGCLLYMWVTWLRITSSALLGIMKRRLKLIKPNPNDAADYCTTFIDS